MQENALNKFRTIVSEVSFIVGNPVYPNISLSVFNQGDDVLFKIFSISRKYWYLFGNKNTWPPHF